MALEGEGSPKLPGGQNRGEDDADLAAVEEQVSNLHSDVDDGELPRPSLKAP